MVDNPTLRGTEPVLWEARTKMQARPLRRRPTVEILQVDFPVDELKQLSWHLSSLPSRALFPSANVFEQPLFGL